MEREPIRITKQVQDGCVTASARSFIPHLGIPFEADFLPRLQEFSLDQSNPENNHMLGVAVVAAQLGLKTTIYRSTPLEGDVLPDNAPARAKLIHPMVVEQIKLLQHQELFKIVTQQLDKKLFSELLEQEIGSNKYGLVLLDWGKWNPEAQKRFGNPRHIVALVGYENGTIQIIDPSLEDTQNPVSSNIDQLFEALNDKQQLIFIGGSK